MTTAKLVLGFM